jgi:hypothetical protein
VKCLCSVSPPALACTLLARDPLEAKESPFCSSDAGPHAHIVKYWDYRRAVLQPLSAKFSDYYSTALMPVQLVLRSAGATIRVCSLWGPRYPGRLF